MDRRAFMHATGFVVGVGVLGANAPVAGANNRIRVGIIGTGIRGQQLIGFLTESPSFEIVACCDTLPLRLNEGIALAGNNPAAYEDHRRLLDDRSIDAVVIATPFSHHVIAALDALDAGKHVYCEKTMTKGVADTRRVLRAYRDSALIFQTGFQYHTSPLYEAAIGMIRDGRLGEIAAVNCQWNRNGDWRRPVLEPRYERQINWRMYREYSGGLAAELSAHQMDFCNLILPGGIEHVSGVGGIDHWQDGRETYDNINLTVRYRGGVTATFASLTTNSLGGYRISVLGKKGAIELTTTKGWFYPEEALEKNPPDGLDLVSGASTVSQEGSYSRADDSSRYAIDAPEDNPTPHALEAFATAIRDNRQPSSNVETGALVSIMVQMALDAMGNDRVVPWSKDYELPG